MAESAYLAARLAAPKLQAHFARHIAQSARVEALQDRAARAQPPDARPPAVDAIEAMLDAAFWASLRREEGYSPKISLALLPPGAAIHPLLFDRPLPLSPMA